MVGAQRGLYHKTAEGAGEPTVEKCVGKSVSGVCQRDEDLSFRLREGIRGRELVEEVTEGNKGLHPVSPQSLPATQSEGIVSLL